MMYQLLPLTCDTTRIFLRCQRLIVRFPRILSNLRTLHAIARQFGSVLCSGQFCCLPLLSPGCKTVALTIPELAAGESGRLLHAPLLTSTSERRQPQIHETRLRVNEAILQRKIDCDLVVDIDKVLPLAKATQVQRMSIWEPDGLHLQPEG